MTTESEPQTTASDVQETAHPGVGAPAEPEPETVVEMAAAEVGSDEASPTEANAASEPEGADASSSDGEVGGDGDEDVDDDEDVDETHAYLRGLIESLLFVSDRPLTLKEVARAAGVDKKRAAELIAEIQTDHAARGIVVSEAAGGFSFRSNPAYADTVRRYLSLRPVRLSRAQLETLSIVSYRQPITRPEVDDVRGVDSGPVLKGLLERELVRILGKKDEPGRPMLYGTTPAFLELFGLASLSDLPTLKEYTELTDDSRDVYAKKLGEEAPEGTLIEPDEEPDDDDDVEETDDDAEVNDDDVEETDDVEVPDDDA